MEETLPDFTGKTVVFYISSNHSYSNWAKDGIAVFSPVFQSQGNRIFVVGAKVGDSTDWATNSDCAIAWDSVFSYIAVEPEKHPSYPFFVKFLHPNYQ